MTLIDTADVVRHDPSGEEWLVARVTKEHLYPCGWPPSRAQLKDCSLVRKATAEDRLALLQQLAKGQSENAGWAKTALAELRQPVADAHDSGTVAAPRAVVDCGEAGHAEGRCGNARCLRAAAGAIASADWTDEAACLSGLADRLEEESAVESDRGNDSAACAWSCRAYELRQIVSRMVRSASGVGEVPRG